jgi:hypothetical protein
MRTDMKIATFAAVLLALALLALSPLPTTPHSHLTRSPSPALSTDNDILQSVLEGVFAENNLPGPYMVKYCFDEPTSHRIVVFIGEAAEKAAKGSVGDLLKLIELIKEFGSTIPPETIDCLGRNQEVYALGFKYNIDGSTDFQGLELHVVEYVALHFLEVHRWAVDINDKWKAGKFYEVGYAAGGYGHKLVALE